MTSKEVFELRRQGHVEQAYEAARQLYAVDKGTYASAAMFWTATDMLHSFVAEGQTAEAERILRALERLLPNLADENGWMNEAMKNNRSLYQKAIARQRRETNGAEHQRMGIWGEETAAAYLRQKGYTLLERDWHSGHRDIDIIARDGDCIVFVEVKTRRCGTLVNPLLAVNGKKQHYLRLAMNHYIRYRNIELPTRFDIITVVGNRGSEQPEIIHVEDVNISCYQVR